jgi:hypothetical protein
MEDSMSAVAWDLNAAPARVPARPARPRLVLVPTGDAVPVAPRRQLRLTRAGRLAVTLTVTTLLLAVAVVVFARGAGSTGMPPAADHAVTVQPGQTLSHVAVEQLPSLPVAEAVARLQVANDLPGTGVHAGQVLVVPPVG